MKNLILIILLLPLACTGQLISAEVTSVKVSGTEGNYTFHVSISSPDLGCDQYADWWEVTTEDGDLLYRRILAHSHVNEQPFERSGGKVKIESDEIVIVRAHMNTTGYGEVGFKGNVSDGFKKDTIDKNFAISLEKAKPQPLDCAF